MLVYIYCVAVVLLVGFGVLGIVAYWWPVFFGSYRLRVNQELERLIEQWRVPKYLAKRARKSVLQREDALRKWIQDSERNPHLFPPEGFARMILEGTILNEIHETGSLAAIDCYRRYMDGLEERSNAKAHAKASLYEASRFWERSSESFDKYTEIEQERALKSRR